MGASVGPGSREPDPAVPAASGFDPSRVSRVVRRGGTTETYFQGGVITSFSDPGTFRIRTPSSNWYFEWSDRFGALRVGPNGETRDQPSWKSPFWRVTALWARQGKLTEQVGKFLWAIWNEPPKAIHYFVKRGRSRVIVRSDIPDGFDDVYSVETYIECDSDGNPKGEDAQRLSAKHDSAAIAQPSDPNQKDQSS